MFHYNTTIWWTIVWLVWLQQPNKLWGKIQKPLIQHGHHHNYHEHDEHKHHDHDHDYHHHYHQHYQPNHHRKHSHSKHHQHYESPEYELVKSTTVATDATKVNPLIGGLHSIANINTFENNELSMLLLPSSHQRHQQQEEEEEENKLMAATATTTATAIFQTTSKPPNQNQMNTSKKPTRVIPKTNLLGEIVNFHISTDKKPLLTPWLKPTSSSSSSASPSSSSTTVPDTLEQKNAERIISTDSGYDQSQGQQRPQVKEKHFNSNSNSNSNSNKASTPFSMRHNKFNLNAMTAHHHYRRQHHHVEQFAEEQIDYGGDEQDQEPESDYYYDEYAYGQDSDEVASSSMKTATDNKHRDHDQHADNDDDNNNDNITGNNHSHFGILNEDNLSDRSYTRITRSRLDEDYADDEPYHNTIIDELQRDDTPGLITEQKYSEVGNEKAVQQARDRYIQQENNKRPRTPHELATDHWHRMITATKCRKPMPRVIPVSNNTSKRYEPYATILHRCGEDTGCCGSTASVCTVKRYEVVMVYVFSYDFNYRKEIEALPMHNHTECHCVNRGSLIHDSSPRGKRSGQHRHLLQPKQPQLEKRWRYSDMLSRLQHSQQTQHRDKIISCPCPHHFHYHEEEMERHVSLPRPHTVFTRKCRCDCLVNDSICERYKRGEESFPSGDRKCIAERNCKPPICSFGDYNSELGKCPAVRDSMVDSFSRSPYQLQQQSHRHPPTNQERHLIKLDLN